MRKQIALCSCALGVTLAASLIFAHQADALTVSRIGGSTRYETAYQIASEHPSAQKTIVLASGENFPDALAASSLAGTYDAPILLTAKNSLSSEVGTYIKNNDVRKVIVVGGSAAVSNSVVSALKNAGVTVQRVYGQTRQETAREIADSTKQVKQVKRVIVANALSPWDSLSVSPYSYGDSAPVFLTEDNGQLSNETVTAIRSLNPSEGVIIVGGNAAVSSNVETQLQGIEVNRWGGATRYETSQLIADESGYSAKNVSIASGVNFPDALAGGAAMGAQKGIMLLSSNSEGSDVSEWLYSHASTMENCSVLGGSSAVSDKAFSDICIASGYKTIDQNLLNNAKKKADYYLSEPLSRADVIDRLKKDGYASEVAAYAADSLVITDWNSSWNNIAVAAARNLFDWSPRSRSLAIDFLVSTQRFTQRQSEYAVDHCAENGGAADWNDHAKKTAAQYLSKGIRSYEQLYKKLIGDGFTTDQAAYGASSVLA